jgi:hypothetical protein
LAREIDTDAAWFAVEVQVVSLMRSQPPSTGHAPVIMSSYIPEEPPEDNEQYEPFDEALDDEDIRGEGRGPEGQRDLDSEITVVETELEEAGANLADPDQIAMVEGGMDDPDGTAPPADDVDADAGWDVDPVSKDRGQPGEIDDTEDDPELELIDVDPNDLDEFPDDAPGADSARW